MRVNGTIASEQRRQELLDLLQRNGSFALSEVAQRFGVHEVTVRRDLEVLERDGIARRVRGGAVAVQGDVFELRMQRAFTAKRQIAKKLLGLVPRTGSIAIDASTTLVHLAREITSTNLSVMTNGWSTFDALQTRPGVRPFLTGGESEERNASLVGSLAVQGISTFHFERVFMSTMSIDPDSGTSEPTIPQVDVKRAMADVSAGVVLAVDSSKLNTRSSVRALALREIDFLVTELSPDDERLDEYRNAVELL